MISAHETTSTTSKTHGQKMALVPFDSTGLVTRLSSDSSHTLAPGVSVPFMASSSECLLEVDQNMVKEVLVDGKLVSEIATIQPGQIISIDGEKMMLVRHLHAVVLPHQQDQNRPRSKLIEKSLETAVTILAEKSADSMRRKSIRLVDQNSTQPNESKPAASFPFVKVALRMTAGLIVVGIGAMFLLGTPDDQTQTEGQSDVLTSIAEKSEETKREVIDELITEASIAIPPPAPIVTTKEEAKEIAPKAEIQTPVEAPKVVIKPKVKKPAVAESVVPAASGKPLSDKDRQTVAEYKLEARFDRANARAKMLRLAESYPKDSAGRLEIEHAAKQLQ